MSHKWKWYNKRRKRGKFVDIAKIIWILDPIDSPLNKMLDRMKQNKVENTKQLYGEDHED